jgi:hypothetical protein
MTAAPHLSLATPDNERYDPWSDPDGKIPVDVAALTGVVKTVIKAGPVSERRRLWMAWESELAKAQEISEDRYPWEPVSQVSRVSGFDALRALHVTLAIINDLPTRNHLITVAADECDRLFGKDGTATPDNGKHLVRCADMACHELFTPDRSSQRFCCGNCRTRTFKRKRRAEQAATLPSAADE